MKHSRFLLVLMLMLMALLAACSPGHLGGNEIAFVRGGHLWTIDPDGANAFEVESDSTPVVGYAWSPSHEIFFYRTLDPKFAATTAGKRVSNDAVTGLAGDAPSTLNTISIDGGSAIPIQFSNSEITYSNAWWIAGGSHLLYRESFTAVTHTPETMQWWVSQSDQPGGIARKNLPNSFAIPSIAPGSNSALGSTRQGIFTTTLAGTNVSYLITPEPPGHPLAASLERFLWQPAHTHPAILYALIAPGKESAAAAPTIQLVLRGQDGQVQAIAACQCNQFAWSPDGNNVLFSAGATFTIVNIVKHSSFSITAEDDSVPYWSPDSRFLLLDGHHTLRLINAQNGQQQVVLSDGSTSTESSIGSLPTASVNALLQPVANSLWSPDSRHFVFVTRGRSQWAEKPLGQQGLYTATIDDQGQIQGTPALADGGNDSQPGWSYEDANTSFLY